MERGSKMINIEKIEVTGWESTIRGMRNPMNSWDKSDSYWVWAKEPFFEIGDADLELMEKLAKLGGPHAKYRRMIHVTMDITAPLYWWKEFDTYKVGTVANSCSTMHKIHAKKFTLDDFSHEHLNSPEMMLMDEIVDRLNARRDAYIQNEDKNDWWQMIQLLPSSYNQKRTVSLNYETLANIYANRVDHKLDEWRNLCQMVKRVCPHSQLFTLEGI